MKRFVVSFLVLTTIFITGLFAFYSINSQPLSSNSTPKYFVVNQGDGLSTIAARLEANGFIKNRYLFMLSVYRLGLNSKLQAGAFKISASLTPSEIAQKLSTGGSHDYWFKIAEGSRIEEIANSLPVDMDITSRQFIDATKTLEGSLFPDSYLIPQGYSLDQILSIVQKNFDQKLAIASANPTNTSMTPAQIITFASLLEREGRSLQSKQQIAGVLLNRLNIGMALQVDASVQYAKDSSTLNRSDKQYWRPVTKSDISIVSPYNTYQNPGLTPSPICNPGSNALYAAYHPIKSDYLFYITGNDNLMHFAKTLEEHNQNIAKYLK